MIIKISILSIKLKSKNSYDIYMGSICYLNNLKNTNFPKYISIKLLILIWMNIETKSIPNFFQVSVNTDKLNQFFAAVTNGLANHDKKIQLLTRQLIQLKMQLQQKLSKIKSQIEYERQRADKKRRDDDTFFNSLIQDSTKKNQKIVQQTRSKFSDIELEINQLNSSIGQKKINQLRVQMQQQKMSTDNNFADLNLRIKALENQFKNSSSTQDFLLKNMIHAYQNKGKTDSGKQKKFQQKEVIILRPNRQFAINNQQKKGKTISIQKSSPYQTKQSRQKKKKRVQQRNHLDNLQYASVSAKIDALDLRLTAKENQSLNKVMWAGKNTFMSTSSSQKDQKNSVDRIEFQSKNLEFMITTKLEQIQKIIYQKIAFDQKQLNTVKNLCDLLKDQMQIANRKIQKESIRISDFFLQLKKIEEKRVDQKMVQNFIVKSNRQIRLLEQELQQTIRKEDWHKEQTKIASRLDFLNENLAEKAEKEEVKKAFRFIEDKIKQIVIIMAEEQQGEKDGGAGKKIPYKCLSCDKQLQNSLGVTQKPHLQNRLASRGSTSNLRKRIRVGNNEQR